MKPTKPTNLINPSLTASNGSKPQHRLHRSFSPLSALLLTQFLSAFADNMILFITLAMIKLYALPDFYIGVVQGAFLFAFVLLAPFVGAFADKNAKSTVLCIGNAIKAAGIVCLFAGLDPAVSYAIVGIGAAVYSPAKYGILTELTSTETQLLSANAKMEGFTILAILTGSLAGGTLAGVSITSALAVCLALYLLSLVMTLAIPKGPGNTEIRYGREMLAFFKDTGKLFSVRKTRFALIGTGSFWMISAVFRLALIAWVPMHLAIESLDQISMLTAITGIGIMIGALATPKLIPAARYYKAYRFGAMMVAVMLLFPLMYSVPVTIVLLLMIGFAGGVFIVPMNAALQDEGHKMVGAGKTIAVQNMFENVLMLSGVGIYTQVTKTGVSVDGSVIGGAIVLAVFVAFLWTQVRFLKSETNLS
ncbi:lysophospholipid transporter LplT [Paenibacillus xerothermodurans]|uniref:Lysophospholipid transporter LplT n=1 Tax=Paenibacillus xerothermodurans TaxID=1977292 RepID=A0A2W1NRQ7_PAEXE|nr:lysophospholipid transporter LplT [Paenibacillus xerothermodurans]PZE20426.1 lysophospholipid transporter LplT [Paenibacillus xerothermodurans]